MGSSGMLGPMSKHLRDYRKGERTVEAKAANAEYMRGWLKRKKAKDPEAYRASVREATVRANANGANANRQTRANRKRRAVIDAIKQHVGCADCGAKDLPPECYDFDHLPGEEKSFSVGMNMRRSVDRILDEIQKCEVVCANCHRTRTRQRKREAGLAEVTDGPEHVDHVGRYKDMWQMAADRGLLPVRQ